MNNWQPMETAAKDGTDILIVAVVDTETVHAIAWWCPVRGKWTNDGMNIHQSNFLGCKPLPPAPTEEPEPSPSGECRECEGRREVYIVTGTGRTYPLSWGGPSVPHTKKPCPDCQKGGGA